MNVMRRRMLQLVGIGIATIASPMIASALEAQAGGAFKMAMGPVSAPQKPAGPPANSAVTTCSPYGNPCPVPRNRPKHRHAHSAAPRR
jgi:hypothetical protein